MDRDGDGADSPRSRRDQAGEVTSERCVAVRQALAAVASGQVELGTLKAIEELSVRLRAREFEELAAEFPFDVFFEISVRSEGLVRAYALVVFCFYGMSDALPLERFVSPDVCDFLMGMMRKGKMKVFSAVMRFVGRLARAAPAVRVWFIENGVLEVVGRFPGCLRIPSFLECLLVGEPALPVEVVGAIRGVYEELAASENEAMIVNVLKSMTAILESGVEFDFSFLVPRVNAYADMNGEQVLVRLMEFVTVWPTAPITLARVFVDKLVTLRKWALLRPMLDLFVKRCDEWKGFVDDELIESVVMLSDGANYAELERIVKVILLYFDFTRVFDERVVRLIVPFCSDPNLAGMCFERLLVLMDSTDQRQELLSMIEESVPEIAMLCEQDGDLAEVAASFLQKLDEFKANL